MMATDHDDDDNDTDADDMSALVRSEHVMSTKSH